MTKLEQLKVLVRKWEREKSMAVAYEICEFLTNNLDLEESRPVIVNGVEYDSYADYLKSREEKE